MVTQSVMHSGYEEAPPTPEDIAQEYVHLYKMVHGQTPTIRCVSKQWFYIDGQTVHYRVVTDEIRDLRQHARHLHKQRTDKSLVKRLINRLRRM